MKHTTPGYSCVINTTSDPGSVNPALVMSLNCDNSADNVCYIWCGDVSMAKKGHKHDSEKGVPFAFRMQDRRTRQIQGPAHMLP
jgi:hypothetical protein